MTARGYNRMCEVARLRIDLGATLKEVGDRMGMPAKTATYYWQAAKDVIRHSAISSGTNAAGVLPRSNPSPKATSANKGIGPK